MQVTVETYLYKGVFIFYIYFLLVRCSLKTVVLSITIFTATIPLIEWRF